MEKDGTEQYFELQKIAENVYSSKKLLPNTVNSTTVYGGLLFAQSLAAAETTVPEDLRVNSLHSLFVCAAVINEPVTYRVNVLRNGKSFCSRIVQAEQHGDVVFSCQLSFHKEEDPAIKHQVTMPLVPKPEDCMELYDSMEYIVKAYEKGEKVVDPSRISRLKQHLACREEAQKALFEMRPVNIEEFLSCKPNNGKSMVWFKCKTKLPADSRLHRLLLAYNTDSTLAGTPVRYHQSRGFVPSQVFSLDHSAWIHNHNFRVDEWMLYENVNITADGGRALTTGFMWASDGRLICSTAQECLVRTRLSKSVI